jgi:hypothetical protein
MGRVAALKLAIDLLHFPARARSLRSASLPDGVLDVIRVAAGDGDAVKRAAETLSRSREMVREAAEFYVEQVLLYPGADSYRVLGAKPDASYEELRRSMALLVRWLHPDGGRHGVRAVFASRVTEAWNDLKTKDRRDAYDRSVRRAASERSRPLSGNSAPLRWQKPTRRKRYAKQARAPISVLDRRQPYDSILTQRDVGIFRRLLTRLFGRSAT